MLRPPWRCPRETPCAAGVVTGVISFLTAVRVPGVNVKHSTQNQQHVRRSSEKTPSPRGGGRVGTSRSPATPYPPQRQLLPGARPPPPSPRCPGPPPEPEDRELRPAHACHPHHACSNSGLGPGPGHHSGRWAPADRAPVPSPRPGDTRAPRRDPLGPLPPQTAGERGPPLLCKMISLQNGKPHTVPPCWRSAPLLGAVSVPEHGGRQPGPRRESQRLTGRKLNQRERLVSAPGSTCWFGPLLKAGNVHCLNLHFFSTL